MFLDEPANTDGSKPLDIEGPPNVEENDAKVTDKINQANSSVN